MPGTPPYTVRSGSPDRTDERLDDLDSAIALASECMDAAEDQVDIVDSTGSIVFDPPELVDRIMEHRAQRSARLRRLQSSNRLRP